MDLHVLIVSGSFIPVLLGLMFAFSAGFRDSATIVATVVSTQVLTPGAAYILCAIFEFGGALLIGQAVASTIGTNLVGSIAAAPAAVGLSVLTIGMAAAFVWGVLSWWRAWPTSSNHALAAGLTGASLAAWGIAHFENRMVWGVLAVLILSPLIGFSIATVITLFLRWVGEWLTRRVRPLSDALHVFTCLATSCAHGSNDGQMLMGILAPALLLANSGAWAGSTPSAGPAMSLRVCVAVAMASGVLLGGRRILKKLGMKFYRIRDPQGLGAGIASAGTILTCAWAGLPASTTQVIAGSIVGAGVAKNPRAVRWLIAREVALSWIITFPTVGVAAYLICKLVLPAVR